MNQKMPYFAYCNDAQHLVCLSRNRMYVNLMNLESGDCITTFKAGEDRFLNSLLVSGDGRYDIHRKFQIQYEIYFKISNIFAESLFVVMKHKSRFHC